MSSTEEVDAILTQLVAHFRQTIHQVDESPPYFDPLIGKPFEESPVLLYFFDRLVGSQPSNAVFDWIAGYKTEVHVLLRMSGCKPLPVLQNYEVILSKWLDTIESDPSGIMLNECGDSLSTILRLVVDDLLFATKENLQLSKYIQCNVLLPTLLRIIYHINRAMLIAGKGATGSNSSEFVECCVALLAFLNSRFDPTTIDPAILEDCDNDNLFQSLCHVPQMFSHLYSSKDYNRFFSLKDVDWTSATWDGSANFGDPITGIAARASEQAWIGLATVIQAFDNSRHLLDSSAIALDAEDSSRPPSIDCVLRFLGINNVVRFVSACFFGTGREESHSDTHSQVFLGRRVLRQVKPLGDEKYKVNPSVIPMLMNVIRVLGCQDSQCQGDVIDNLVPCCLELLDSTTSIDATLGACALGRLLAIFGHNPAWNSHSRTIVSRLEDASKLHREGPVVMLIGRAQVFASRLSRDNVGVQVSFCRQWINGLHRAPLQSTSNVRWEILVGALIPLLREMAKSRNVRLMDLGRLALSSLLPLVSGEFVDARTQVVSTTALINFMLGAYPILPHHGGKITCHLLSGFVTKETGQYEEERLARELNLYAAALALAMCGESSREVVEAIEAEPDKYQEHFILEVSKIRSLAVKITSRDATL